MWLVDDMLARPEPPLLPLTRITETPVVAPDGSLETEPGYHAASETFDVPLPGLSVPPVPERPTMQERGLAKALIFKERLRDFPFVNEADKAHAIGLFEWPYVRDLIPDPTANHLIEPTTPGSGKGLLAPSRSSSNNPLIPAIVLDRPYIHLLTYKHRYTYINIKRHEGGSMRGSRPLMDEEVRLIAKSFSGVFSNINKVLYVFWYRPGFQSS